MAQPAQQPESQNTRRLGGRVAVVTGGGGGIGREHALQLARAGARVVVNDLGVRPSGPEQMANATRVVEEIRAEGGTAVANDGTAATWAGAEAIVEQAIDEYGRIDILVNNATRGASNDIWRFTEKDWDTTVDVNLKGYFAMIRFASVHMCRQHSGVIINTSSGSGFGHPANVAYAAAKEGVIGLTRTVAKELGRFGIRCNAIRPGAVTPGGSVTAYLERTKRWTELMDVTMQPAGRSSASLGTFDPDARPPRKVAAFVVWLCTDAAAQVNGRTFHVVGDQISRLSEPVAERLIFAADGWDLDALDEHGPSRLLDGVSNPYTLDDYPHLQVFDE
jgi:NAD(P)-dependent dehydrogenase (short-subunit alcohol dehydrogenase family)